jgi:hypothetical protein
MEGKAERGGQTSGLRDRGVGGGDVEVDPGRSLGGLDRPRHGEGGGPQLQRTLADAQDVGVDVVFNLELGGDRIADDDAPELRLLDLHRAPRLQRPVAALEIGLAAHDPVGGSALGRVHEPIQARHRHVVEANGAVERAREHAAVRDGAQRPAEVRRGIAVTGQMRRHVDAEGMFGAIALDGEVDMVIDRLGRLALRVGHHDPPVVDAHAVQAELMRLPARHLALGAGLAPEARHVPAARRRAPQLDRGLLQFQRLQPHVAPEERQPFHADVQVVGTDEGLAAAEARVLGHRRPLRSDGERDDGQMHRAQLDRAPEALSDLLLQPLAMAVDVDHARHGQGRDQAEYKDDADDGRCLAHRRPFGRPREARSNLRASFRVGVRKGPALPARRARAAHARLRSPRERRP